MSIWDLGKYPLLRAAVLFISCLILAAFDTNEAGAPCLPEGDQPGLRMAIMVFQTVAGRHDRLSYMLLQYIYDCVYTYNYSRCA